jgi:hypothetical protein
MAIVACYYCLFFNNRCRPNQDNVLRTYCDMVTSDHTAFSVTRSPFQPEPKYAYPLSSPTPCQPIAYSYPIASEARRLCILHQTTKVHPDVYRKIKIDMKDVA